MSLNGLPYCSQTGRVLHDRVSRYYWAIVRYLFKRIHALLYCGVIIASQPSVWAGRSFFATERLWQ